MIKKGSLIVTQSKIKIGFYYHFEGEKARILAPGEKIIFAVSHEGEGRILPILKEKARQEADRRNMVIPNL